MYQFALCMSAVEMKGDVYVDLLEAGGRWAGRAERHRASQMVVLLASLAEILLTDPQLGGPLKSVNTQEIFILC